MRTRMKTTIRDSSGRIQSYRKINKTNELLEEYIFKEIRKTNKPRNFIRQFYKTRQGQ